MKTGVLVAVAGAILLAGGCEQKSTKSDQQTASPSPAATAASATPQNSPSPSASASPAPTPASPTNPPPNAPSTTPSASPATSPTNSSSDARPSFSSRSANEYVQTYDAYIDDFKVAYESMKQGDMTKYQKVIQRARELQTKGDRLAGELTPEEQKQFADYLNRRADELAHIASPSK